MAVGVGLRPFPDFAPGLPTVVRWPAWLGLYAAGVVGLGLLAVSELARHGVRR